MKIVSTLIVSAFVASSAVAASPFFEGFEDAGWTPGGNNWNNGDGGEIVRVASGTNGITSADGNGHAIITNLTVGADVFNNPSLGADSPFTRLGGYSADFDGGFTVTQDIYLDTMWTDGQGFDFSTAANGSDGNHQRDFVWHVGVIGTDLIVNASNNTDFSLNDGKLTNENGGNNHTIASSGWHTFETVFYADGGLLSVDYNLYDENDNLIYTVTRGGNAQDTIPGDVGGNRYGYFAYNNIDGLAIDNTTLVPTPGAAALLGLGGLAATRRRRA